MLSRPILQYSVQPKPSETRHDQIMHPRLFMAALIAVVFVGLTMMAVHESERYRSTVDEKRFGAQRDADSAERMRRINDAAVKQFEKEQRMKHGIYVTAAPRR